MLETLLQSSYFALFLIIALGFILGRIQIKGLSLDVSAVIFIALLFGHFGVIIPKELGNFGLVLFIFTIGIQAGPGFFDSFRSKGKTLIILTLLIVGSASLTGLILKYVVGIDTPSLVGLIAGALTSTPGLAVAIDSTHSSSASIAYGIAYPFGVIGVILFIKLLPKLLRKDLIAEAKALEVQRKGKYPPLHTATFRITHANIFGKTLAQLQLRSMTGAVISRIKHKDRTSIPVAQTILHEGDMIKAVGNDKSLEQLALLVGERVENDLPFGSTQELQSLLVTNKNVINKSLGYLNLQRTFNCTVTRVRRSGIDLSPEPELMLKFGDKLMVAGEKEDIKELGQVFGNDEKKLSDTDFFPIAAGIVLGVLFGKLNISFSDSFSFSPGLTGGILIVALILSAIGKTDHLVHVRFRQPVTPSDRPTSVPRRGRNIRRCQPGIDIPRKWLDIIRNRYGNHNGTDDRGCPVRLFRIQNPHLRLDRDDRRRNDQYARTCRRRFDERQFCPQHRVCDGLSDCDGVPNSFYPVHRRIGRIRIMRVATS